MRISDWSSDVCSSDLDPGQERHRQLQLGRNSAEPDPDHRMLGGRRLRRLLHQRHGAGTGRAFGRQRQLQGRSEEHTSELQSLMRISYAVFCLKKKNNITIEEEQAASLLSYDAGPYTTLYTK